MLPFLRPLVWEWTTSVNPYLSLCESRCSGSALGFFRRNRIGLQMLLIVRFTGI